MPQPPPGLFDKVNFIWRYVIDPCDAPLNVYVSTALPAALKLFMAYYFPDIQNILLNILRPSKQLLRLRGRGKFSRGAKNNRGGTGTFLSKLFGWSLDDVIGKWFSGEWEEKDRKVGLGLATLWTIFGVVERINFWIFVAEITTDFFYEWFSGIHKLQYCEMIPLSIVQKEGNGYPLLPIIGWTANIANHTLKQRGSLSVTNGVFVSGFEGRVVIVASYDAENRAENEVGLGIRLRVIFGADFGRTETIIVRVPQGATAQAAVSIETQSPCVVWAEDACFDGLIEITQVDHFAVEVVEYPGSV